MSERSHKVVRTASAVRWPQYTEQWQGSETLWYSAALPYQANLETSPTLASRYTDCRR